MHRYLELERIENFKRNLYQPKDGEPCGHNHFIMMFKDQVQRELRESFSKNIHPRQLTLSQQMMNIAD